jgi:CubicO group peptidase (beta-lactamase class C family)
MSSSTLGFALRGVVLSLIVVVWSSALAQSTKSEKTALPSTKAGQFVGEWIKLCQAPDLDQLTKWQSANLSDAGAKDEPAQDRAHEDLELCTLNGGFRVVAVTQSDPNAISVALVGLKSDIWFKQRLAVDGTGKLDEATLFPTAPAESALPKDLSDAAIRREVNRIVAKLSGLGLFSGIVTVARGTQAIASASGGYADRARKTPITGSTQFTLGSMGKMFTAASIGHLVDEGKMSFGDTVGKFFPDYPNSTVREKVTVGMLLSHTAGMDDFLGKRTPEMMTRGVKRAVEFMPLYDHDEPQFVPGTHWAYSNSGLALAGAIVEKVSGEDYPNYIRRHIFAVAAMTNSDPNDIPHSATKLVTPYTKQTEGAPTPDWREAEHDIGSPAGGAISSADDLVRFAEALRSGKLVSHATFEEMRTPSVRAPTDYKYGYAMEIENLYSRTIVGHSGGFPGVSTRLYLVVDSPYTVIVLSNEDPPAADYVGSPVVALVAKKAKLGK